MPDLEKVIKGLEMCIKDIECTGCPYEGECFDAIADRQFGESMMTDALTLLKEQEPVAPVLVGRMWECGKCYAPVGIFMDDRRDQFCRTCGRRVKWDA